MKNRELNPHIAFLRRELDTRLEKNPRYSMRAFANLLGVNIGTLSSLLNGKRALTLKTAKNLLNRLGVEPNEQAQLLARFNILEGPKLVLNGHITARLELEEQSFRAIAEWQNYAILQIVRTQDYLKSVRNLKWMARQLKITEVEAKLAIQRLIELNLLSDNNGVLKRTEKKVTTANKNLTSAALRKLQRQIREKAIYSLEHDPLEIRSMTSMTMAIDPKKIARAKALIDEFQEKLSDLLEKDQKQKVYQLEISLFPLQIMEN